MESVADEWVGEDVCLFPYEDIRAAEELEEPEVLGEAMKGCCVQVGPHQITLYMARQRADDLHPDDLGLRVWPGTHAMAFLLLQLEDQGALAGRSALDVGCGTGFIGILACLAGCGLAVLSDRPGRALSAARLNARANANAQLDKTIQVKGLSWGPGAVDETGADVYNLVLMSEVLYVAQPTCVPWSLDKAEVEDLAMLAKKKLSPDGDAYVTYGNREGGGELFRVAAEFVGLSFRELPVDSIVPKKVLARPSAHALRRVRVFHLRHAR